MARARGDQRTLDLLNWQPPEVVRQFEPEQVRAASLRAAVAKAVGAALKDCAQTRECVAEAMSEYLGEPVGKNILDAYASEAREEHVINVVRFLALVHATGDDRLLQLLVEPFGLAVIDRKYLPAIEAEMAADLIDEMRAKITQMEQRQALARKRWKGA